MLCEPTLTRRAFVLGAAAAPAFGRSSAASEPSAEELLRAMAATLTGAGTLSVEIDELSDRLDPRGHKVLVAGRAVARLARPDRLYVDAVYEPGRLEMAYTGQDLVVLNHARGIYGTYPVSGSLDRALETVSERFRVFLPIAELFSEGVLTAIASDVIVKRLVGPATVAGDPARHVLLLAASRNMQLWLREEDALPLRMVVTDVESPKQPQRIFTFKNWRIDENLADGALRPVIPDGYRHGDVTLPAAE